MQIQQPSKAYPQAQSAGEFPVVGGMNTVIHAGLTYPQQFGYCDMNDRWLCEKCYERYVLRRDLAFVDEL